jgi:beta-glucosidase
VASVDLQATKDSLAWQSVSCGLPQTAGSHFVIFRFRSEGSKPFFHLASFELAPASAAGGGERRVVFAPGSVITGRRNEALLRQAESAARSAEVVLLFLGVNRLLSDEGRDRESIDLPSVQHELAERVMAVNPRTVVVLNTNCPVAIEAEDAKAPAILCALFGGEQQGHAMADAIFGEYNPGGKLSSTWYRGDNQLPNFHDYNLRHGRTYLYFRGSPLYPFGFGLSYTSFALEKLELASQRFSTGSPLGVRVDVANRGDRAGDEVVQLYVQATGTDRPEKQLAAFKRVRLEAGEKRTVSFSIPADHIALQFWDEPHQSYVSEPGTVHVMAGRSSAEIELNAEATLE